MEVESLINEINNLDEQYKIIDNDLDYLAECYIKNVTDFELPMNIYTQVEITLNYKTIKKYFINKILNKNKNIYIDECLIDSYIFYYINT